jgi:hypothetical protein
MRVGCGSARGFVFLRRKKPFYFKRDAFPFVRGRIGKDIRQCAPAHIAGKDGFFVIGRIAVFCFNPFECFDGGDVALRLRMRAALSDAVGIVYPEVAGWLRFADGLAVESDDDSWGASVGGNAHSRVASSQAA